MKRNVAVTTLLAVALALTACGGGSENEGSGDEDWQSNVADTGMSAEIEFAVWEEDLDWQGVIEAFNEEYPEIKVSITESPFKDYFTRLQTQASGNNLPDVFYMNGPNFQLYASHDMLLPLDWAVDEGTMDLDNYPEAMTELYSYEDVLYGMPISYDSIGLWYNKAIFEEAGVGLPTDEWTWDDLHSAAKEISDNLADEGIYGFAGGTYNQELVYNLIYQAGGEILNEDSTEAQYSSEGSKKALQFLRDMVVDGSSPSIQTTADTTPDELFKSGKAAMVYGGSFRVGGYADSAVADDIDVVQLPAENERAVVLHGGAVVADAEGSEKAAATAFALFVGTEEAQQIVGETGTTIPAFKGTEEAYISAHPEYNLEVFPESAESYGYRYPVSENTQAWIAVETEMIPKILSGELTIDEGTAQLDDEIDALLEEGAGL